MSAARRFGFIPASVRQDIIERTDGIPLFVEEMTKAILEVGSEWDGYYAVYVPNHPRRSSIEVFVKWISTLAGRAMLFGPAALSDRHRGVSDSRIIGAESSRHSATRLG